MVDLQLVKKQNCTKKKSYNELPRRSYVELIRSSYSGFSRVSYNELDKYEKISGFSKGRSISDDNHKFISWCSKFNQNN